MHVPYAQPAMLKVGIKSPGAILRGFCVSPVGESPKLQISWSPRQKGVQFRCGQEKYSILFVFRTLPVSPMLSGLYGMPKTQLLQSLNLPYRYGGGGNRKTCHLSSLFRNNTRPTGARSCSPDTTPAAPERSPRASPAAPASP